MDDPAIWSAVHRMATVMEKLDGKADMGVFTGVPGPTADSINKFREWIDQDVLNRRQLQYVFDIMEEKRKNAVQGEKTLFAANAALLKARTDAENARRESDRLTNIFLSSKTTVNLTKKTYKLEHPKEPEIPRDL